MHNNQRIGILTAGGDCPGINAAIRGVGKTAIVKYGMKVIGISDGFQTEIKSGLSEGEIVAIEVPVESGTPSGPSFPFGPPH